MRGSTFAAWLRAGTWSRTSRCCGHGSASGYQSSLAYMERNVEKRADPRKLVEGARTAVVCAVRYKNRAGEGYPPGHRTKVASYACAADYHTTIKGNARRGCSMHLARGAPRSVGAGRSSTRPRWLEKQLAVEAGLGWIGRQSLLVTPRFGTYVLLGELLLTDDADAYDPPFEGSRCGTLPQLHRKLPDGRYRRPDRTIDTGRCISCHTIEKEPHRGNRPRRLDLRLRPLPELAAPGTSAPRSTATRRSTPCSTRWRWTPRHGWRWTKRRSKPSCGTHAADPQRTGTHPKQHRPATRRHPNNPSPHTQDRRPALPAATTTRAFRHDFHDPPLAAILHAPGRRMHDPALRTNAGTPRFPARPQ